MLSFVIDAIVELSTLNQIHLPYTLYMHRQKLLQLQSCTGAFIGVLIEECFIKVPLSDKHHLSTHLHFR